MLVETVLINNNIQFIDKGKDLLISCLSVDHEDVHPSMRISKSTGIGYCFSCGYKIDIFNHFNIIKDLSRLKVTKLKNRIVNLFPKQIQTYPVGRYFLNEEFRGISKETISEFKAFVCEGEPWSGRIWFPILDLYNDIILFQGRYISSELEPKYLFEPRHITPPLYPYNIDFSRGSLLVVEGIFDLLNLWDNGIKNVICSFGLSISRSYNPLIDYYKILGIHTLIPLFDNDKAGNTAITDFSEVYKNNFIIKKYSLPPKKDPGDLDYEEILDLKISLHL